MDDELNRFVAQKQKELFTKTDVRTGTIMSHDINFLYFGVFNPKIDASLSFSWILKCLIWKNDCFSRLWYGKTVLNSRNQRVLTLAKENRDTQLKAHIEFFKIKQKYFLFTYT